MPRNPQAAAGNDQLQRKRKQPCQSSNYQSRAHPNKRVQIIRDARTIVTQTSDKALNNGELDLQSFVKAREFEIKALEDGMRRSKKALTTRAFQQVPRDMRRRTASHNAKRVPKRLQIRAKKEMRDDNTPTVTANRRKPGSTRARLRAETAKKLGFLAEKKKARRSVVREAARIDGKGSPTKSEDGTVIVTRSPRPKIRNNQLSDVPRPRSKFRKRQMQKTWLPTHMYHTKRARMTEPKNPLWRFAIPLTPSAKSYRPMHRQSGARGAVCWDMSYISTIGLEGPIENLERVLQAVGITEGGLWAQKGLKWRAGKRSWCGCLKGEEAGKLIHTTPVTVIWAPKEQNLSAVGGNEKKSLQRKVLIRVHPSAFLELWNEILRISKTQLPLVHVEDLRFEIGSIEITGPGSTETLLGILHPSEKAIASKGHADVFSALAGVTNPASLPPNALLGLSVSDPRLYYPPKRTTLPKPDNEEANFKLLELLSSWPADSSAGSSALFDKDSRYKATVLPSQKSINRRKALAPPGTYPSVSPIDPDIPIMLLASRSPTVSSSGAQGSWTLLAPWKCILPFWYGFMHYPLSSGGNPAFGGLEEQRQINFEHGVPWFPGDFPGTKAGWAWEQEQREKRKNSWDKRPKGKRVAWEKVDLGGGRKGEIGIGWSCDFEKLVEKDLSAQGPDLEAMDIDPKSPNIPDEKLNEEKTPKSDSLPPLPHLSTSYFTSLLKTPSLLPPPPPSLATIRITIFTGVPQPCARIYRLPSHTPSPTSTADISMTSQPPPTNQSTPSLRQQWLSLLPDSFTNKHTTKSKHLTTLKPTHPNLSKAKTSTDLEKSILASLLQTPALPFPAPKPNPSELHPLVPGEEDLIGFVTSGNFNLAVGKGVGFGSVVVGKVLESWESKAVGDRERKLCIVRNAGMGVGRLGTWEVV